MEIWNFFMCSQGQLKRNIVHNFVQTYDQVKYILKQSKPSIILFYSKKERPSQGQHYLEINFRRYIYNQI